ncbi:enoyl-CoA hydratase [Lentibacillus kapialis]|uniref:Enoyl-CoA hydratase n=1 Tax=Lentibacillus kapialis TaxID=340214 RepID=A0A917PXF9_9BACI|nr:MaoC/PaaZ C-terminal domain-containing protein [Lentibacillus kapialis]GGJ96970.1 enoyl-CoA hydratase [Lentibacillus kapialis]
MIGKKRKLGERIEALQVGQSYTTSHIIEDKDLLLYLGLTDDANPLYLQHDYASQTPYKRPIVPSVMLFGMVTSTVSMHLPGPGSHITRHEITFPKPLFHYSEIKITLEVIAIDIENHEATLSAVGFDAEGDIILQGKLNVSPAYEPESWTGSSLENFF